MNTRLRIALVALLAFLTFVVVRSLLPSDWHGLAATPAGAAPQTVVVRCGPAWGSGYVHAPAGVPIAGQACDTRVQLQIMSMVDIVLAVVGIGFVVEWGRRRSARGDVSLA